MEYILFVAVLVISFFFFRRNYGNYFILVSYEWETFFKVMGIPKEFTKGLKIQPNWEYMSVNGNDSSGLGIDSKSANFEYFISPRSVRNGGYSYSSIYDQQLKKYFSGPNIVYRTVLADEKKDNYVHCFMTDNATTGYGAFTISFHSNVHESCTVIVLFEKKYFNLTRCT